MTWASLKNKLNFINPKQAQVNLALRWLRASYQAAKKVDDSDHLFMMYDLLKRFFDNSIYYFFSFYKINISFFITNI